MRQSRITIAMVGDLMLQFPLVGGDRSPGSAAVWDAFAAADLVVANLECPLTARGAPADKHVAFRSDPALARDLRAAGIDVVTLANNHMFDYGLDGMYDTLDALRAAGVAAVGAGRDLASALAPAILTAGGVRVAFVGLASTLPVGSGAAPDRPGIAPVRVTTSYVVDGTGLDETPGIAPVVETRCWPADVEAATAAVAAAKRAADVCVVAIHWGVPNGWVAQFQDPIAMYQRPLAQALVAAGADAIVGHHPHVLHGIEVINGRPVFHSLGNFLFHSVRVGHQPALRRTDPPYLWKPLRSKVNLDSAIAMVTVEAGHPSAVELIPIVLNSTSDPELAAPQDAARILATLTDLSAPLGAAITTDGTRGRLALGAVGAARRS
jgi:poly-gamma-glutamate synthesis protein (capsule biosynthesis protein)